MLPSVKSQGEAARPRAALVRRGLRLNYLTLGYNTIEAMVSLAAGLVAGSVALVGFGVDSAIEVTASLAAQWRLRSDHRERREQAERIARRIIGCLFWPWRLRHCRQRDDVMEREAPGPSVMGAGILILSVLVMPLLAREKRRVARTLQSGPGG